MSHYYLLVSVGSVIVSHSSWCWRFVISFLFFLAVAEGLLFCFMFFVQINLLLCFLYCFFPVSLFSAVIIIFFLSFPPSFGLISSFLGLWNWNWDQSFILGLLLEVFITFYSWATAPKCDVFWLLLSWKYFLISLVISS